MRRYPVWQICWRICSSPWQGGTCHTDSGYAFGNRDAEDAVELKDVKGSIAFEHVSFHYGNKIPVLKDISFSCKPGDDGCPGRPTGVGKTTMTQLLSRFYDPWRDYTD